MPLVLILIAIVLAAAAGLPGADRRQTFRLWRRPFAGMMSVGALFGLSGAGLALSGVPAEPISFPVPLIGQSVALTIDPLSAFFLVPVFLIGGLGAIYGLAYWPQADHPADGRKLRLFWGGLTAGMATLVVAANGVVFLMGWEVMALSAFLLITTEDDLEETRRAGWIYLIATHVGTLCLLVMFCLLGRAVGSFALIPITADHGGPGPALSIFILAIIGFGLKAGIMPFHFWLPAAHANAPSHVSAVLSGVMIKMGIYGLVRITGLLPEPPVAWGATLLILGAISGVLGVAFAIGQHSLKRLLAHHSVENIGIIVMGLGLAMVGRGLGRADWALLGMSGCLLHVWNHCLFKSLLFFSAGSVIHGAGTMEMDRMGAGRADAPDGVSVLVGALAICGLPPLNGFISELFLYIGFFRAVGIGPGPSWTAAALGAPVLAMIGAMAALCFVKAYGAVFLGVLAKMGRQKSMSLPKHDLSHGLSWGACAFIGLFPFVVAPILDRATASWAPAIGEPPTLAELVLSAISAWGAVLLFAVGAAVALLRWRWKNRTVVRPGPWDCGYARPTARMQYTASSFAQMFVELFGWILRPRIHRPDLTEIFPPSTRFESHVDDVVLEGQILPLARLVERLLGRCRRFQQGQTQQYALYILIALFLLLAWTAPFDEMMAGLLGK